MSNPLFQALAGNRQPNMMSQFQQFMQQMQGRDPNQEIAKLLQSGKISQQQLNHAQQMAQQLNHAQQMAQQFQGMMGTFKR